MAGSLSYQGQNLENLASGQNQTLFGQSQGIQSTLLPYFQNQMTNPQGLGANKLRSRCSGMTSSTGSTGATGGTTLTQSVVTGSRSLGSIYNNTSGFAMIVTVSVTRTSGSSGFSAVCDSSSSPSTTVAQAGANMSDGTMSMSMTFCVPPSYYYKVINIYNSTLAYWTEWTF